MLVKWNRPNTHSLASEGAKKIYQLRPGWNEFPSDVFKKYESHPEIKRFMDEGVLELMKEEKVEKKGKKVTKKAIGQDDKPLDLKDLGEAAAIKVVKETFNRDMLQRWIDEENRSKVKRALSAQLKPLKKSQPKEED